jgi:Flp pilus assembly protein protease CpaA
MRFDLVIRVAATAWLVVVAWQDWRKGESSNWLSVLPLLGVVGWRVIGSIISWAGDGWNPAVADGLAIGLGLLAVVVSDRIALSVIPGVAGVALAFAAGSAGGQVAIVSWLVVLGMAHLGIMGGLDAKVLWVLVSVFDSLWLVASIGVGVLAIGSVMLLIRHGLGGLALIHVRAQDLLRLRLPERQSLAEQTAARGIAAVPILAAGALVYLWPLWIFGVS